MLTERKELQNQESGKVEKIEKRRTYVPAVDIYESENEVKLFADLPGVPENGVDVSIEKNILTIEGRVNFEEFEGLKKSYAEYGVGDYKRSFTISNEIDADRIEAIMKNGVLSITLPKLQPQKKKIEVKAV